MVVSVPETSPAATDETMNMKVLTRALFLVCVLQALRPSLPLTLSSMSSWRAAGLK